MKLGKLGKRGTAAAALALAAGVPAVTSAQSVTLYGVVDTGVEYINHVGAAGNSVVKMANLSGTVPSRWGLRGTEDLGSGMKANFVLESGFAPDSGTSNQGGRLFGRQAWVGLSSNWGQVSFGRQYTMLFWATLDSDILGPNAYGSSSLDNYLPNTRADNSIAYKGKFGGFTVGATYSFGRDTVNAGPSPSGANCAGENAADSKACREWSALLMYETNWWSVHAAYDSLRGGPGAFAGLTSSGLKDDRLSLGGYMLVGKAKAGLGWIGRRNEALAAPRSNLFYAGVAYDIAPAVTLAAEGYYLQYRHSNDKAWLGALRASYAFSKRTSVYATGGYIDNHGSLSLSVDSASTGANPVAGGNQLGAMVGVKHTF
ncbi:Outer membrane protein (porin) [Cupriavidus sp. OV038]|jgi:predicted porin|uniref:Porin n=1 Tax=Cupriavidus campinensis TaxID=151783 RepID=A0AAE9L4N5_9BURK|nr:MULTISPECIES: porin [Cupriavidus]URF06644.1 porin [Cupriavidus campinensis]SFC38109.1 Outer membrane protein (porin) [Cupriavidus sp. OV038]SFP28755.1 Outer membrane protein (porin) [Cupriavidus sp. OV096]